MKKIIVMILLAGLCFAGIAAAAVNVNTANVNQLETLKGVGKVKAHAIVADRKAHGAYATLDALTRVKGIGDKTVDGLRSEATTGDQKKMDKGQTQ